MPSLPFPPHHILPPPPYPASPSPLLCPSRFLSSDSTCLQRSRRGGVCGGCPGASATGLAARRPARARHAERENESRDVTRRPPPRRLPLWCSPPAARPPSPPPRRWTCSPPDWALSPPQRPRAAAHRSPVAAAAGSSLLPPSSQQLLPTPSRRGHQGRSTL